jgi:hypothetical protein
VGRRRPGWLAGATFFFFLDFFPSFLTDKPSLRVPHKCIPFHRTVDLVCFMAHKNTRNRLAQECKRKQNLVDQVCSTNSFVAEKKSSECFVQFYSLFDASQRPALFQSFSRLLLAFLPGN